MNIRSGLISKVTADMMEVGSLGQATLAPAFLASILGRGMATHRGLAMVRVQTGSALAIGTVEGSFGASWFGEIHSVARGVAIAFDLTSSLPKVPDRREVEWAWRRANEDFLRQNYLGQWIALEGQQIVANGPDPQAVVAEARRKGIRAPYIFQVLAPCEGVSWVGL